MILAMSPVAASGNGAFPDSLQILLPEGRPEEIGLSTNFGLLLSDNAGRTWTWVCEGEGLNFAYLYQVGPQPENRFAAVAADRLVFSEDRACTWTAAQGLFTTGIAQDMFMDPTNSNHVLAIAFQQDIGLLTSELFESQNGGRSFEKVLFRAPMGGGLTSVELARSDPRIVYLAMYTFDTKFRPHLARSLDGGETWQTFNVEAIALDPKRFESSPSTRRMHSGCLFASSRLTRHSPSPTTGA
jgi:hypothetical protein